MDNLKVHYKKVVPELQTKLALKSVMQVPSIKKITLNMGVGEAVNDRKHIEQAMNDLRAISGQQPVVTRARKSIAGFKIREGWPLGCKVTLRGERMYEFLQRLLSVALPRVRDFRGLSKRSFDGQGNYSLGITEQLVFPEIRYDKIDTIRGLDITISTNARNDDEGLALLQAMNFPFKD